MKYGETIPFALAGRWVRQSEEHEWIKLLEDGTWTIYPEKTTCGFNLTKSNMLLDTWGVREEPRYVWVAKGNGSLLFGDPKNTEGLIRHRLVADPEGEE